MKRFIYIYVILIISSVITAGCSKDSSDKMEQDLPSDFNFRLIYGTYGKQEIDTFHDKVTKDLVADDTIEANIALTEQEMKQIYDKMISIDIMGELDLEKEKECLSQPESISSWTIQMNGITKSFYYKSYCDFPKDVLKLKKLEDDIHSIITNKEEYKKLPEANGYYE